MAHGNIGYTKDVYTVYIMYICSHRPDVAELTRQREQKLERYRQQKKTEQRLRELHQSVMREHVDDEVQVAVSFVSHDCFMMQMQNKLPYKYFF